jgi:ribosomal protein L27
VDVEKEHTLFLAIFKDSQEAEGALKIYHDDLVKKGKVLLGGLMQFGTKAFRGEDSYQGKVMVLQKGFYLLGSVGFEKEEEAENRLAEFMKNVR